MKKKVYICAPLGGNVKGNIAKVRRYAEYALKAGVAPVVSHFYALCLNDNDPAERRIGMEAGQSLLWFCDAMWIFGDEITEGMKEEIRFCEALRIPMKKVSYGELKKILGGQFDDTTQTTELSDDSHSGNDNTACGNDDFIDDVSAGGIGFC